MENFVNTTVGVFTTAGTELDTINNDSMLHDNMTVYDNSTVINKFPTNMLGFTTVCAFIIAIFGSIGNIITILALLLSKKLRNPTTAYVINLAVAELLFCLIILPISGAQYLHLKLYADSWLTDSECISFAVIRYTLTQAELQTIVAIAFTRATAVGCPRFYQRINTKSTTSIYIVCIWIYSFALKLPTGLGIFGSYKFNPKTMECDMANDILSKLSRLISIIVEVLIPVLTIFILYIYIFVMVRKSSLRVSSASRAAAASRSSTETPIPSSDEGVDKGPVSNFKILKRKFSDNNLRQRFMRRSSSVATTTSISSNRRDVRLARTIFTIFLVLLICSVPVGVIHGIDSEVKYKVRFLGVHILYWTQYCLNMIIYVIMNRQYRDAYVDLFAKISPSFQKHKGFVFPWETPSMTTKPVQGVTGGSFKKGSIERKSFEEDHIDCQIQERLPAIQEINNSSAYMENEDTESMHEKMNCLVHVPGGTTGKYRDIEIEEAQIFLKNDEVS